MTNSNLTNISTSLAYHNWIIEGYNVTLSGSNIVGNETDPLTFSGGSGNLIAENNLSHILLENNNNHKVINNYFTSNASASGFTPIVLDDSHSNNFTNNTVFDLPVLPFIMLDDENYNNTFSGNNFSSSRPFFQLKKPGHL